MFLYEYFFLKKECIISFVKNEIVSEMLTLVVSTVVVADHSVDFG